MQFWSVLFIHDIFKKFKSCPFLNSHKSFKWWPTQHPKKGKNNSRSPKLVLSVQCVLNYINSNITSKFGENLWPVSIPHTHTHTHTQTKVDVNYIEIRHRYNLSNQWWPWPFLPRLLLLLSTSTRGQAVNKKAKERPGCETLENQRRTRAT